MNTVEIKNLGVTFTVGETYNHSKWGEYKILSLNNNGTMVVMFKTEESKPEEERKTTVLTIKIAATMIFNEKCSIAKAMNRKTVSIKGTENQIAYTIGRIASMGSLYVCGVQDKKFEAFKYRYEKAGNTLEKIENITVLCNDSNKWGIECSISLPILFTDNDYFALPEDTHIIKNKDKTFTINDNNFWWYLVEKMGFVIGNKQDIEEIKENFPTETLKDYFLKGVKGE
jgi:hypothetical protein